MECYNPRTNEWTYVAKMNEPHYGHAGTVYGGYMYISGTFLFPVTHLYDCYLCAYNIVLKFGVGKTFLACFVVSLLCLHSNCIYLIEML